MRLVWSKCEKGILGDVNREKEIERLSREGEEKRKNMDKHLENAKKQTEYNDQLARNRHKDQLKEQEKFQEQLRKDTVDCLEWVYC